MDIQTPNLLWLKSIKKFTLSVLVLFHIFTVIEKVAWAIYVSDKKPDSILSFCWFDIVQYPVYHAFTKVRVGLCSDFPIFEKTGRFMVLFLEVT